MFALNKSVGVHGWRSTVTQCKASHADFSLKAMSLFVKTTAKVQNGAHSICFALGTSKRRVCGLSLPSLTRSIALMLGILVISLMGNVNTHTRTSILTTISEMWRARSVLLECLCMCLMSKTCLRGM